MLRPLENKVPSQVRKTEEILDEHDAPILQGTRKRDESWEELEGQFRRTRVPNRWYARDFPGTG